MGKQTLFGSSRNGIMLKIYFRTSLRNITGNNQHTIFPKGEKALRDYFTGKSHLDTNVSGG